MKDFQRIPAMMIPMNPDVNSNENSVLITGGAGFIGSHLAHKLAGQGFRIRILDNLVRGRYSNVEDLVEKGQAVFVNSDIRDFNSVRNAMKDVRYVFHLAAVCINYSLAHPEESLDINILGTYNVLKAASEEKVGRVIFSSSASVYGNAVYLPMDESHPLGPITPYCVSKIAGENLMRMPVLNGLKFTVLRYFNVYGIRQAIDSYYTSVLISFINRVYSNEPPVIMGDGTQSMDLVNVRDVVQANIMALSPEAENQVFNVGSGSSTSIKELAWKVIEISGKKLEPLYQGQTKVIVKRRQADISKIRKSLRFEPTVDLDRGLREIYDDYGLHPDQYSTETHK